MLVVVLLGKLPAAAVELEGTWHVLVHYRDTESEHPERKRWEDRVWVFEREGDRLRWREYPIVVFDERGNRFAAARGGAARRVLGWWEPNAAQREQIRTGLEVNTRGSKTKTLRRAEEGGWSTGGGSGYRSARYLTYEETWEVEGLPEAPVFRRKDVLGGAAAESLEGQTVYTTVRVEEGGDRLEGRYVRDGRRVGSFRMQRAGPVRGLDEETPEEASTRDRFFREAAEQLFRDGAPGARSEAELRDAIEAGTLGEAGREDLRAAIRADLEAEYRRQGNDPREHRAKIESLTEKIERRVVEEGRSFEEVRELLRRGELRP